MVTIDTGDPYPIGASFDGAGTNVSVFSSTADAVELCLFDDQGAEASVELPGHTGHRWHGYVHELAAGQTYGFRIRSGGAGEATDHGRAKLLLDPYAKAIDGAVQWDRAVYDHQPDEDHQPAGSDGESHRDSAPFVPRSVVVNPWYDWGDDRSPRTPWKDTVIYEAHVKGLTMRHPEVPAAHRGRFLGVAEPPVIDHLQRLGVTAVELLPVQHFIHDHRLHDLGLRNYWGYNTIGFFAPHGDYAQGARGRQVTEFKTMVRELHRAGIEVILDVVYNHTAEAGRFGPTLSFRGLDKGAYYVVDGDDYPDVTGTGNTTNAQSPDFLQLVMDSLRYWVTDMHVDGFRFDLAPALAREKDGFDSGAGFLDLCHQDPILNTVKLIAEPWDLGDGGYRVGGFGPNWSEWNGRYRDSVRSYWAGATGLRGELAARITGSADIFAASGRAPSASVNFVTAHDGFTLHDLVTYEHKHNEANGEDNRDGTDDNRSWNCGIEGPTDDPGVLALRARQSRNILATLLLSQGVPMLLGGDEMGRTQHGSNNAYAQDNEISWLDWDKVDGSLMRWTVELLKLRREHPVFRRTSWFSGEIAPGSDLPDIAWFAPDGSPMSDERWSDHGQNSLGVYLNGDAARTAEDQDRRPVDRPAPDDRTGCFYLAFNAHSTRVLFRLPDPAWARGWSKILDTHEALPPAHPRRYQPGARVQMPAHSMAILQQTS